MGSLTEAQNRSTQEEFENELRGVQWHLRGARRSLLTAGMKLQDTGRPEIEISDIAFVLTATDALRNLQERIRELLADVDLDFPVPVDHQQYTAAL